MNNPTTKRMYFKLESKEHKQAFYKKFLNRPGEDRTSEEKIIKLIQTENFIKGEIYFLRYKNSTEIELWKSKKGKIHIICFSSKGIKLNFPLKEKLSEKTIESLNNVLSQLV